MECPANGIAQSPDENRISVYMNLHDRKRMKNYPHCTIILENNLAVDERDETFVNAGLVTVGSDKVDDCEWMISGK